jgi:hypothetical protein
MWAMSTRNSLTTFMRKHKLKCNYHVFFSGIVPIVPIFLELESVFVGLRPCMLNDHFHLNKHLFDDFLKAIDNPNIFIFSIFDGLLFICRRDTLALKLWNDVQSDFATYNFVDVSSDEKTDRAALFLDKGLLQGLTRAMKLCADELLLHLESEHARPDGQLQIYEFTEETFPRNYLPSFCGWLLGMPYIYFTQTQQNCLSGTLLFQVRIEDDSGRPACCYTIPQNLFDPIICENHFIKLQQQQFMKNHRLSKNVFEKYHDYFLL